jgi:hypothetical protein
MVCHVKEEELGVERQSCRGMKEALYPASVTGSSLSNIKSPMKRDDMKTTIKLILIRLIYISNQD